MSVDPADDGRGRGEIDLRRRTVALAVVVFALSCVAAGTSFVISTSAPAGAGHRFDDVVDGTFFHASTGWLAEHGVADGFADGSFRPNDQITRGQASHWFANYNGSFSLESGTRDVTPSASPNLAVGCASDMRAIAGGGTTNRENLFIRISQPTGGNAWQVIWLFEDSAVQSARVTVWALCAPSELP